MSNKLKIALNNNAFSTLFDLNFKGNFLSSRIKIDTGCTLTSIALGDILKRDILNRYILDDYHSFLKCGYPKAVYSIGVNDRDVTRKGIFDYSDDEILKRNDVGFAYTVTNLTVGGISFGKSKVKIMYNRKGSSLLGMNILRNYNSRVIRLDNKCYFILNKDCLSDKLNCMKLMKSLLYNTNKTIEDVKNIASKDYSEDCINDSLADLLSDQVVIGKIKEINEGK